MIWQPEYSSRSIGAWTSRAYDTVKRRCDATGITGNAKTALCRFAYAKAGEVYAKHVVAAKKVKKVVEPKRIAFFLLTMLLTVARL